MKVIIIGAGIAGLSTAWYLQKEYANALDITILEASGSVGGKIQTKNIDGFFYECGPRSIRGDFDLINELQLQDEVLVASKYAKRRFLASHGRLKAFTWIKCLPAILTYPLRWSRTPGDVSIATYFGERFGASFVDTFIDPFCAGIYAGLPDALSYQACFPKKRHAAQIFTFKQGMQTLTSVLAVKIKGKILLNTKVLRIDDHPQNVTVLTDSGLYTADRVISTVNPTAMLPPEDPLRLVVPQVPKASLVTVSLGYYEDLLPERGFGFLASSKEERRLLGVIFDSCVFPQQNGAYKTRLSVMLGGAKAPHMLELSDDALYSEAVDACKKYLGVGQPAHVWAVTRHPHAISQYPVGHLQRMQVLEEALTGRRIQLAGADLYDVSIAGLIKRAEAGVFMNHLGLAHK